jgi:hypothetical protein
MIRVYACNTSLLIECEHCLTFAPYTLSAAGEPFDELPSGLEDEFKVT